MHAYITCTGIYISEVTAGSREATAAAVEALVKLSFRGADDSNCPQEAASYAPVTACCRGEAASLESSSLHSGHTHLLEAVGPLPSSHGCCKFKQGMQA